MKDTQIVITVPSIIIKIGITTVAFNNKGNFSSKIHDLTNRNNY